MESPRFSSTKVSPEPVEKDREVRDTSCDWKREVGVFRGDWSWEWKCLASWGRRERGESEESEEKEEVCGFTLLSSLGMPRIMAIPAKEGVQKEKR
jgi:hypothetical protein